MAGTELHFDPEFGATVLNDTNVSNDEVFTALREQHPEYAQLSRWVSETHGAGLRRTSNLFQRDRYVTPDRVFEQMAVAYDAAETDDVVSGVLETTEALAFGKMSIETEDEDETDIWNQIAADLDFDSRLREMWRDLFICSQVYVAVWWGTKSYKVRGKSKDGVKRKKEYRNLRVPTAITLLDPTKVVPVGNFLFGKEQLAYIADRTESQAIESQLNGSTGGNLDPIIQRLMTQKYTPTPAEKRWLQDYVGVQSSENLYLLDPNSVFRHTATRPPHQKMATVRMKSIFELLDMKHQLRQMDRAHLIGGTNFIVLVKKGSEKEPAKQEELENLGTRVNTLSRVPVIVSDHRLEIEIITPTVDNTLSPEKYNGLDARITARMFQMFMTGNYSAGAKGDDSIKLARVVARGMESRRLMLRRSLEQFIIKPTQEKNEQFETTAKLRFHPKNIALDFDANMATYLLDLRDRGDISRETILEQIDMNQSEEARRREYEKDNYDKIMTQPVVPYTGEGGGLGKPAGPTDKKTTKPVKVEVVDPKAAGRTGGGNRNGGGAAPGTGQGQAPRNPRKKSD